MYAPRMPRALAALALALAACAAAPPAATPRLPTRATERPVRALALAAPLDSPRAELSGLAWHGEDLILLPQYPDRFGGLFALPRAEIEAVLDGRAAGPLVPRRVPLDEDGLAAAVPGFEGYESIAFLGDRMFLTIEAHRFLPGLGAMTGWMVSGRFDGERARLDAASRIEIPAQAGLDNTADEAMTVADGRLITFYEANGATVNPTAVAHVFDPGPPLRPAGALTMTALEYRLTDATPADAIGRFWAINYLYPGDRGKLRPAADLFLGGEGPGEAHSRCPQVERLVRLRVADGRVVPAGDPPIQLSLLDCATARNWEGLAELPGRGFLLATDQYPATVLGFVADP